MSVRPVRIAVIDLYNDTPNEGMRAIGELLTAADGQYFGVPVEFEVFETRFRNEIPDDSFEAFISTGGPGSPFEGEGSPWEATWFDWVDRVWNGNRGSGPKRHALFICHSFQMMIRHFDLAEVLRRRSQSFGVFMVHPTEAGLRDPLFGGLKDPFYAADFRHWQVVQPSRAKLGELGASVLAVEKQRPHVHLERALMALRVSDEMVGVQFHPEADPAGMSRHFRQPARKEDVIRRHGAEKYERIVHRLENPGFLKRTHDSVIPNFLRDTVAALRPEAVEVPMDA